MWMQTLSGRRYNYDGHLSKGAVWLPDIAHSLSLINRFNGHTSRPISVAEHACAVGDMMRRACPDDDRREAWEMIGLMHDAHEAYIGDVSATLKPELDGYDRQEDRAEHTLMLALPWWQDLNEPEFGEAWRQLKHFDRIACRTECHALKGGEAEPWGLDVPIDREYLKQLDADSWKGYGHWRSTWLERVQKIVALSEVKAL